MDFHIFNVSKGRLELLEDARRGHNHFEHVPQVTGQVLDVTEIIGHRKQSIVSYHSQIGLLTSAFLLLSLSSIVRHFLLMLRPSDFLYLNRSVPDVFNSVKKCNKRLCFSRVIILRFRAEFGFFRDLPTEVLYLSVSSEVYILKNE